MNLKEIGEKRQKRRKETDLYKVKEDTAKPKFYVLDMFPYPSGAGLHVGHPKGYIASDTLARKKMLQGFNVLHPMGFDTFGLGTENYAIEHKMKPQDVAKQNIENYIKQLEMFGTTYDRSRSVNTADPEYFKRTQRVFLQMYNHYYDEKLKKAMPITDPSKQQRLAYVDYKPINRCPHCMTGLANEDLDDGKCERCGSEVEQKPMKQRVLRITKYAERLLEGLNTLHREESMKDLERNRIGRSEGTEFKMKVFIPENEAENTGEGMSDTKRKLSKESNDGTYDIIGIAMKVHKELGPGLQEKIYQKGLKKLLEKNGFKVEEEKKIEYKIDGEKIGYGSVDLLVNGTIAIELKSRKILEGDFYKQLRTYINQSNTITCGFLMNFYNGKLDYKRLEKDYLEGGSKKFLSNSQIVSQKSSEILSNSQDDSLEFGVYTTRIDTVFGMSFVAIAPEHPLVEKITTKEFVKDVEKYKDAAKKKTQLERTELQKEKTGVFCGAYAINPFNNEKVPVFVADYVLANYGTGVVMAVPAHDERDFEFAKKYGLPITQSIAPFIIEKHDKEGYTTNHIDSFTSIIKHRSEDKYLLIKFQNNKFGFVGGKPDGDETKVDTLRREIVEETGYTDFEIKEAILEHAFGLGYKPHKDRIDQCHDKVFLVHLLSDKNIGVSEEEKTKHSTQRATKEEINDLILVDHHQFYWDTYIKGPSAFTEKGILVDSGEFTGMTSEEAIPAMQKRLEKKKIGGVKVNYKMQDRVFSRQRYRGEPFPVLRAEEKGSASGPHPQPFSSKEKDDFSLYSRVDKDIMKLAKDLRKKQTPAEEVFWELVRNNKLGYKFRRQQPFDRYIVDFYCHELKLVIEIDGGIHDKEENKRDDKFREKELKRQGLHILRFTNEDVLDNPEKVIESILSFIKSPRPLGEGVGGEGKLIPIPLDESDLPLLLPDVENYEPTGTEEGPLANITDWVNVTLPDGTKAKRETNTMPGRAGSSWYWLRYMDPTNDKALVGKDKEKYRGNVDVYIGGAEHVTRHMIYGRFWQKFLYDIGAISHDEPFQEYHYVGLIMGEDGRKMSKRRGNVVNPDDIISQFGADTLRTYEMFMGPFDQAIAWNTAGISGTKKFLDKVQNLLNKITPTPSLAKRGEADGKPPASTPHQAGLKEVLNEREAEDSIETQILLNQTIKKVGENIDEFKFNTAISQLMILTNHLTEVGTLSRTAFETLVILLSPFAPHLAEELWEQLGNEYSIFTKATWPKYDEKLLVADTITIAVQVNGKVRGTISLGLEADEQEAMAAAKADEKINNRITSEPKKVIYVKGKILNIVV